MKLKVSSMIHNDSVHPGDCCCQRIVIQFDEIKSELQNIRQTVDVAVTLLSKLVAMTPDDIQMLTGSMGDSTPSAVPDSLSIVNSVLRRDSTKEVMGISSGQTTVMQSILADVFSENDRTRSDKVNVEVKNNGTSIEDEKIKSAIEAGGHKSVAAENSRTVIETGNDKCCGQVKNNKLPVVSLCTDTSNSVSEHLSAFVKTSFLTSLSSTANITKDHSIVSRNTGTSEQQSVVVSDPDISVDARWLEPQNKETDTSLPADTLPGPSLSDVTSSHMLLAAAVCHMSASQDVHANRVEGNADACMDSLKVKQEQSSEHDDDGVSLSDCAITVDERLQESEQVKVDPEGVFISDALQPVCLLVKNEEGFYASNIQQDDTISLPGSHSTEQFSGQTSVVNTGDELIACSKYQSIGHMIQDSTHQIASPLHPLLGSALVSKLKQKIQEKIQAAVYAVNEEKRVEEGGNANVINTNTCMEMSHSLNKDSSNVKELSAVQSKLRQKFYQCKSCTKIFFCNITLHIHKYHCRGLQKRYHCSSCPLMFKSRAVLFSHQQLHCANKSKHRHKCEVCGRQFILKSTLKKHRQSQLCKGSRMKCYRKLPQHFCSQCGEGFLNCSNLELHQKLHKVGETHSSSSVVEDTNSDSCGTSVHVPRAVRRYPCGYCDEAFIDRRSVALHEKLHTDKEFATFDEERKMILRKHQLMVMFQKQQQQQQSNRKKYGCDVCGRCYSIELLLHMHTRLHHAIS